MAVQLISHPFRILLNGEVAKRDDMSQEYLAERIGIILATEPGERPLVPLFGINDPAYEGLVASALESQVVIFDLPVTIEDVTRTIIDDERVDYVVSFDIKEETIEDE